MMLLSLKLGMFLSIIVEGILRFKLVVVKVDFGYMEIFSKLF